MKLTLIKQLNGSFKTAYDSDYEKAKKIKLHEPIEFEYKIVRNYNFHKKFFALINMVFQNQEFYTNLDSLRKDIIIEAGFFETRITIWGEERIEAKSINFASMDNTEFTELYDRCLDVIVKHFHFEKELIKENIEQFY